jgi:hypothetical protein
MVVLEAPVMSSILDELTDDLTVEQARWNDAGLTPEDLGDWLPPGLPLELEYESLQAIDFTS